MGRMHARFPYSPNTRTSHRYGKVYDDYVQKQTVEELKRIAKVSRAPNMCRCATDVWYPGY